MIRGPRAVGQARREAKHVGESEHVSADADFSHVTRGYKDVHIDAQVE